MPRVSLLGAGWILCAETEQRLGAVGVSSFKSLSPRWRIEDIDRRTRKEQGQRQKNQKKNKDKDRRTRKRTRTKTEEPEKEQGQTDKISENDAV